MNSRTKFCTLKKRFNIEKLKSSMEHEKCRQDHTKLIFSSSDFMLKIIERANNISVFFSKQLFGKRCTTYGEGTVFFYEIFDFQEPSEQFKFFFIIQSNGMLNGKS